MTVPTAEQVAVKQTLSMTLPPPWLILITVSNVSQCVNSLNLKKQCVKGPNLSFPHKKF